MKEDIFINRFLNLAFKAIIKVPLFYYYYIDVNRKRYVFIFIFKNIYISNNLIFRKCNKFISYKLN